MTSCAALFGLIPLCALVSPGPAPASGAPVPRKPNVLLLIADGLNTDLGCYGANVSTPNLDTLAAHSVRFERAYCSSPIVRPAAVRCSPATGRHHGRPRKPVPKRPLSPHFREKLPEPVTLPQFFRPNGWITARVGKIIHQHVPGEIGTGGLDDPPSWDFAVNPRGRDRDHQSRIFSLRPGEISSTISW